MAIRVGAGHDESAAPAAPRPQDPHFDATFSPDGTRLLLSVIRFIGTQGNVDILAINADGSGRKMAIAEEQGKLVHQDWPAWSPDGKRLAFSSTHDGNQEIYTAALDGSDIVRLTQSPGHDAHPCWSPDGKSIAFATDRWGRPGDRRRAGRRHRR